IGNISTAVAETDDIDVRRSDEFQQGLGFDKGRQVPALRHILVYQTTELLDAVLLERHPYLECPEATACLHPIVIEPCPRCQPAGSGFQIFGGDRKGARMQARLAD